MDELQRRMTELERRVELLERHATSASQRPDAMPQPDTINETGPDRSTALIQVKISNKRYDPANPNLGSYEDHIWFDCLYTPSGLSEPTRAIKGLLEFADHFGEVRFRIQVTLNETLSPGRPLPQNGIGFTYNQFLDEHQWMLATKVADMKWVLRLTNVLYVNGTTEAF